MIVISNTEWVWWGEVMWEEEDEEEEEEEGVWEGMVGGTDDDGDVD